MKNARLAGGLLAIGIGLLTIGLGQYSSQSHAMVASPEDGVQHWPWEWNQDSELYIAQVSPSSTGTLITAMLDATAKQPSFFASALLGGQATEFQITLGTVSISGGDFTFPAGSTILGGEPETVSLQGMHAQVQGHAGLHVQNSKDIDALTKRIEQLEAIIESLPDCACSSDVNRDGLVNGADLTMLLGAWGPCTP